LGLGVTSLRLGFAVSDKLVFKEVSRAEFDAFIEAYPRKLEYDLYRIGEPPLETWNDFTLGVWPRSIVAKHMDGGSVVDYPWKVQVFA
jgi:hypothetical protein